MHLIEERIFSQWKGFFPPYGRGCSPLRPAIQVVACMLHTSTREKELPQLLRLRTHANDSIDCLRRTLVGLFKECAAAQDLEKGCSLHADFARLRLLEGDIFVGSTLINMYVKCGSVAKAQEVFDGLLFRDVVSWSTLIAGYAEHGPHEEAFNCVKRMRMEGISLNSFTIVCLAKACGHLGDVNKGEEIHTEAVLRGLDGEELIGNSLVDMYTKCAHLASAFAVFCNLCVRDVISWTALIAGYVDCGKSKEALDCYEQMHHSGSSSNIVTYVCVLKACGSIEATERGQKLHTEILLKGFEDDIRIGNTLLDMYFKCGLLTDAEASFDTLPTSDVISWNILLAGYAEHFCGKALASFEDMRSKGLSMDGATSVCLLRACSKLGNTQKGMELHLVIAKAGLDLKLTVANTLVDMYGKFGSLTEAQCVFDKLLVRSLVSWNALITGYAEHAHAEEALQCFNEMQVDGFCPDVITCVCGVKACGNMGTISEGQGIHLEIVKLGMEEELPIANSLIHMYAKCASLAEAHEIFDNLSVRDVVSWTALMVGWAQFGKSGHVLGMFERMIREGVTPNSVTLLCILNACSDEGIMFIDQNYLYAVSDDDSALVPTLEHYACVIDMLGRAGLIDKALKITKEMPMNPNIVIWLSMLGACRNWGNVELGKVAFENALHLDSKSEAAYICMYNIFVEAGMHDEACAVEVRRARTQG